MKIYFAIFITVIFGVLILSINDPVFLAGGSDSLDISVLPDPASQSIALMVFFISVVHSLLIKYKNKTVGRWLKVFFIIIALIVLAASGHTYTISGKYHAFVDKWYHMPVQTLEFDPTESIDSFTYKDNGIFISIYKDNQLEQEVLTGPLFWGINSDKVIEKLEGFGVVNAAD
jgi:hypothetical protein